MKCAQCGLPLSPSRAYCPRCGVPAGKSSGKIRLTRDTAPVSPHVHLPMDVDVVHTTPPVWPTSRPYTIPSEESTINQEPFPAAAGSFPPQPGTTIQDQEQHQTYVPNTPIIRPFPEPYQTPTPWLKPTHFPAEGPAPQPPKIRLGFTIAAMCFTAGIMILLFVFIVTQSLSPNNPVSSTSTTLKPHTVSTPKQTLPSPITTTSTPMPTPASNQYINNINLASSVDASTGTALQTTTEFHTGQSIYVTMTIHQQAYNGAVCLEWSVNNQAYPYANSATPGGATYLPQTNAYFYYRPGIIGNGTVEVSWSSSISCVNKVFIQTLNFTVVA